MVRSTSISTTIAHQECDDRSRRRTPAAGCRRRYRPAGAAAPRSVCHIQIGSRRERDDAAGERRQRPSSPSAAGRTRRCPRPRRAAASSRRAAMSRYCGRRSSGLVTMRFAAAGRGARQVVPAASTSCAQLGPVPQRLARSTSRDAAHAVVVRRQPLERAAPQTLACDLAGRAQVQQRGRRDEQHAGGEHERADGGEQVQSRPSRGLRRRCARGAACRAGR